MPYRSYARGPSASVFGQTHRFPFPYSPNTDRFPPPPSRPSSFSHAPYQPLPRPIPKQLPHVCCPSDFGCKLPQPLLVVRFPTLGLVPPIRLQGQARNIRQAVTHTAQKKQCSMRKKKKNCLAWIWLKCTFLKKFTRWPVLCYTTLPWHALFLYLLFYYYYYYYL